MTSRLFLDANILLDFYRYGDDDISEIGKLVTLAGDGDISLYVDTQLVNEIERNREKILSESFSALKSTKYGVKAPNYCSSSAEFKVLADALKVANAAHSELVKSTWAKISSRSLPADQLIEMIYKTARKIEVTEDILAKASRRVELGNPPGKRGSIGDAIHWECLLTLPRGLRFDLVSRDSDFASELDPTTLKAVLDSEWKASHGKHAKITLFPSLGSYFRTRFPKIVLSDETTKNELISRLESSPNFATTHSVIAELSNFSFFTNGQVKRLFCALVENSQVGWIGDDSDVNEFYLKLKDKAYLVDDEIQDQAASYLGVDKDDFFSLW